MAVKDNAVILNKRLALESIASKLAPTLVRVRIYLQAIRVS
jgi:hypothetical protein